MVIGVHCQFLDCFCPVSPMHGWRSFFWRDRNFVLLLRQAMGRDLVAPFLAHGWRSIFWSGYCQFLDWFCPVCSSFFYFLFFPFFVFPFCIAGVAVGFHFLVLLEGLDFDAPKT